jgi:hypothetical protein
MEVGCITYNQKSMSATGRNPKSLMGFGREIVTIPCTVGRGAFAKIDKDIIDRSRCDPYQLSLSGVAGLIVKSPENVFG